MGVDALQPLFLLGLLGGATKQVIDALEGCPEPAGFALLSPFGPEAPRP